MTLKVCGTILPYLCVFLSTEAKTVWGLLQPLLRTSRIKAIIIVDIRSCLILMFIPDGTIFC